MLHLALAIPTLVVPVAGIAYFVHKAKGDGLWISLPVSVVQKAVDSQLPVSSTKAGVNVSVASALVALQADGRFRITCGLQADTSWGRADATIAVSAGLNYAGGKFYLKDFKQEEISVGKIQLGPSAGPDGEASATSTWTGALMGAAKAFNLESKAGDIVASYANSFTSYLEDYSTSILGAVLSVMPVYTLSEADMASRFAKGALKRIEVASDRLRLCVGRPEKA